MSIALNDTRLRWWWCVGKSTATLAVVLLLLMQLVYDAQIFHHSNVTATVQMKETKEDAEVEGCLRPRRNSNAVKKSTLSRPCEFTNCIRHSANLLTLCVTFYDGSHVMCVAILHKTLYLSCWSLNLTCALAFLYLLSV
jgi:hypothetical protein